MKSHVTTRQGDKGQSRLLDGTQVPKYDIVMECVGTIDELRAQIALTRQFMLTRDVAEEKVLTDFLTWLSNACFLIGAACSDPGQRRPELHTRAIEQNHVFRLEVEQARLEAAISFEDGFIASASNAVAAQADVACTVARRAERRLVQLAKKEGKFATGPLLAFVNRLSDYLYVLARYLDGDEHVPVDYGMLDQ